MSNFSGILAIIIVCLSFLFLIKRGTAFVYSIPIITILWDAISVFLPFDGWFFFGPAKTMLLISFFLLVVIKRESVILESKLILLFAGYLFALVLANKEFRSLHSVLELSVVLLMFPVGYSLIDSKEKLQKLNKSMIAVMIVFIINFVVSNIMQIGDKTYQAVNIYGGNLTRENSFIAMLAVILSPLIIYTYPNKKRKVLLLTIIVSIIILINLRRSPILGIGGAFSIYLLYYMFSKNILLGIPILAVVVASMGVFISATNVDERIVEMFEKRGRTIDAPIQDQIDSEVRTREIIVAYDEILINRSWFGHKKLNQNDLIGVYGYGAFGTRPTHTSIARIAYGSGIIGVTMLLAILLKIAIMIINAKITPNYTTPTHKVYLSSLIVLLFIAIIKLYTMGYFQITFGPVLFLYLGSLIGLTEKERKTHIV